MRLDHLLSKECRRPGFGSATTEVEHWLLGVTAIRRRMAGRLSLPQGSVRPPGFREGSGREPVCHRSRRSWHPGSRSSVLREGPRGSPHLATPCRAVEAPRPLAPYAAAPMSQSATCGCVSRAGLSFENSRASTSIFVLQARKSQRWMPWRLKPKKDVGDCDKPRGAVYQASIRGCPNGATRHPSWGVTPA